MAEPEDIPSVPSLAEVLVDMLEKGRRTGGTIEDAPWREPIEAAPRKPSAVAGCLTRLVLLVLFLIALAVAGLLSVF